MTETELRELVVFSLEPWNDVWRRNQHFVDLLLRRNPLLRVLFVEPPADPVHSIRLRSVPELPRTRRLSSDGRLRTLRPLKLLPRRIGPVSDRFQLEQVCVAMRAMGLSRPILWLNDTTYAPLIQRTGYPSLYDMTDDWLLAPFSKREIERLRTLEEMIFDRADEIVVCSPGLLKSRGYRRPVELIPNGVDVAHFARPQPRPADLPQSPVAVYVGSLHESRLDVDLVLDLVHALPKLSVALVGPDSLDQTTRARLLRGERITLVGARPYQSVPGYLQHADVIIVPHVVSPFTESLDPVKAYESLAVERPTVATPVAGFRELRDQIAIEPRERFVSAVDKALANGTTRRASSSIPSWADRAESFEALLLRALMSPGKRVPARPIIHAVQPRSLHADGFRRVLRAARKQPRAYVRHLARSPLEHQAADRIASLATVELADLTGDVAEIHVSLSAKDGRHDWSLGAAEQLVLQALIQARSCRTAFEIGTFNGGTTRLMAESLPEDGTVWTLDLGSSDFDATQSPRDFRGADVGFAYRGSPAASKITQLYGNSLDYDFSAYRESADLVLVDAGHEYANGLADSASALEIARPGGLILWDDFDPYWHGLVNGICDAMRGLELGRLAGTSFAVYRKP